MVRARLWFLLGFLICIFVFMAALYLQYEEGLEPCNLCMIQRLLVVAMAALFLLGAIFGPRYVIRRIFGFLLTVLGIAGMAVAGWHVWLQNLPPEEVPECGPGYEFLINNFPLVDAVKQMFLGSGDCAEVQWRFLTLSIPAWTIVAFAVLTIVSLVILFARSRYGRF